MKAVLDTSGHVLYSETRGGRLVYFQRNDKSRTPVPDSLVIPPKMCERCFQMGQLMPAKLVHHLIHLTPQNISDPKISLSFDNFQRLCQNCHAIVHGYEVEQRVAFDDSGNVVGPSETDDFRAQVMRLTETADERRNIYKEGRNGRRLRELQALRPR